MLSFLLSLHDFFQCQMSANHSFYNVFSPVFNSHGSSVYKNLRQLKSASQIRTLLPTPSPQPWKYACRRSHAAGRAILAQIIHRSMLSSCRRGAFQLPDLAVSTVVSQNPLHAQLSVYPPINHSLLALQRTVPEGLLTVDQLWPGNPMNFYAIQEAETTSSDGNSPFQDVCPTLGHTPSGFYDPLEFVVYLFFFKPFVFITQKSFIFHCFLTLCLSFNTFTTIFCSSIRKSILDPVTDTFSTHRSTAGPADMFFILDNLIRTLSLRARALQSQPGHTPHADSGAFPLFLV